MVCNSNNVKGTALKSVDQGIGKTMEWKRPYLVRAAFTQRGELLQQPERTFDLVDEVIRRNVRAFADIPVNGGIGVGLRFLAKTDLRHSLRKGLWCEDGT